MARDKQKNDNKRDTNEELEVEIETSKDDEQPKEAQPNSEVEELVRKNSEANDKYLRLVAEYDNFRKRSQKERDEIYPTATAAAVAKFLPVLDNFERAAAFPHVDDDFGKGFDMIYQSLKEILSSMGVEEVGKIGEDFNPIIHHAVMHIEDENLGENVVSAVMQKGYKIGEKIIRYAMVQTAN